mmetsp:Transcript_25840/g.36546  ORF Transcript_25840/g.36546 Transcript_25840/m.36546 type:complete len:219 (-) Transcript_25840:362-1018(-)
MGRHKKNVSAVQHTKQGVEQTTVKSPKDHTSQLKEMRRKLGKIKRPRMVTRPKTAWIFFLTMSYKRHKESGGVTSFKKFWTELSPQWKNMNEEKKKPYIQFHEDDKVRYNNEMKNLKEEDLQKIDTYRKYCKLRKAARKESKPRPVLTNYMAFARTERPKIRKENPAISFGELGKLLGARWKTASPEVIAACNKMVCADRERYEKEVESMKLASVSNP